MPSISASVGSSVFGRFGRRHVPEPSTTKEAPTTSTRISEEPPSEASSDAHRGRPATSAANRRDSSILSLATSVSDLGQNVKRSVSLRSHRTQLSASSSSTTSKNTPRFPSAGNDHRTNPLGAEDIGSRALSPTATPPQVQRRLSKSAKSLSNKWKSTDTLSSLATPNRNAAAADARPPTALDNPKQTGQMLPGPLLLPRRVGDRPIHGSQNSFSRDNTLLHPTNGVALHQSNTPLGVPPGGHNPRLVYRQIHQTSSKRIATIEYLRKVHEGNIFYFGTLSHSPAQLGTMPSLQPVKMIRRANNYMVLGCSLPAVIDLNSGSPLELLKALIALLQEFESYQSLSGFDSSGSSLSRGRVGAMFSSMGLGTRTGKTRRPSAAADSGSLNGSAVNGSSSADYLGLPRSAVDATSPIETSPITPTTGHEFTHLLTPHLPFDPDFHTTFATLCDALIDAYAKLLDLISSPDQCGVGVSEAFQKVDKYIRKILVANVVREFEDNTRVSVKSEVAGLGRLVLGGLM